MKESKNDKSETLEDGNANEHNLNRLNANSKYSVIVYAINEYGVSLVQIFLLLKLKFLFVYTRRIIKYFIFRYI